MPNTVACVMFVTQEKADMSVLNLVAVYNTVLSAMFVTQEKEDNLLCVKLGYLLSVILG